MVKKLARLLLFFSVSFIGLLVISTLVRLLGAWAAWALTFLPETAFSGNLLVYLKDSLPAAFYLAILLGLNYASRRRAAYPAVFLVMLVFSLALSGAALCGIESLEKAGFSYVIRSSPKEPAQAGFIVRRGVSGGARTIFLGNPYGADGAVNAATTGIAGAGVAEAAAVGIAAVEAAEGRELRYVNAAPANARLEFFPPKRSFFVGIAADFARSSRALSLWFNEGFLAYGVYAGSLAALLLSLGCLVNISFWPLANLFFGALAYRGVLALENLLNQSNIHRMLASFSGNLLPPSLINPAVFCALAVLILLYSGLVYLARGKLSDG